MKKKLVLGIILFIMVQQSKAGLIGTELSLETLFQQNETSPTASISFLTTAIVTEPDVEFPRVADLEVDNPPFGLRLVNTAINIGDDFLEIDFDNATGFPNFAPGFQNTYVFTFDSNAVVDITGASINTEVTTLGLAENDVTFLGD